MEDWRARLVDDDAGLAEILGNSRVIAVVGAKDGPSAPAYYVPAYLHSHGYRILPVNPTLTDSRVHGERVVPTLADLHEPADIVEVFRRREHVPAHAQEILRLPWKPRVVWLQLGIRHDAAARILAEAGIRVVQDRCMMPEHRRLLGVA